MKKKCIMLTLLLHFCNYTMQHDGAKPPTGKYGSLTPKVPIIHTARVHFPAGVYRVIRVQSPGGTVHIKCVDSPRST